MKITNWRSVAKHLCEIQFNFIETLGTWYFSIQSFINVVLDQWNLFEAFNRITTEFLKAKIRCWVLNMAASSRAFCLWWMVGVEHLAQMWGWKWCESGSSLCGGHLWTQYTFCTPSCNTSVCSNNTPTLIRHVRVSKQHVGLASHDCFWASSHHLTHTCPG